MPGALNPRGAHTLPHVLFQVSLNMRLGSQAFSTVEAEGRGSPWALWERPAWAGRTVRPGGPPAPRGGGGRRWAGPGQRGSPRTDHRYGFPAGPLLHWEGQRLLHVHCHGS